MQTKKIFLVFLIIAGMSSLVWGQESQDSLQLTISSDKEMYAYQEPIMIEAKFTNVSKEKVYFNTYHFFTFDAVVRSSSGILPKTIHITYDLPFPEKEDFVLLKPGQYYLIRLYSDIYHHSDKRRHHLLGYELTEREDYEIQLTYSNEEDGARFGVENAWQGKLISNKIQVNLGDKNRQEYKAPSGRNIFQQFKEAWKRIYPSVPDRQMSLARAFDEYLKDDRINVAFSHISGQEYYQKMIAALSEDKLNEYVLFGNLYELKMVDHCTVVYDRRGDNVEHFAACLDSGKRKLLFLWAHPELLEKSVEERMNERSGRISMEAIIEAAKRYAQADGYDLSQYQKPVANYDDTHDQWLVHFSGVKPVKGHFFNVIVDAGTGEVKGIIRGK